jgi:FkbM family methyltransferase
LLTGGVTHHPVFEQFVPWKGEVDPGWSVNFLGVRTRDEFTSGMTAEVAPSERRFVETDYPAPDEEYFEWIDVLETVDVATGMFTMIELGAGWGRWLMNAATAARARDALPFRLVGVEAEPTHFRWMTQHFRDNFVDPSSLMLIEAAVAKEDGRVSFHAGDPSAWYGQAIDSNQQTPARPHPVYRCLRSLLDPRAPRDERALIEVRSVGLRSILRGLPCVDLIDLDVQGVEADVLESAEDMLSGKVKRVHIGTHSTDNEDRLRTLFGRLGWQKLNDYACATEATTLWGRVNFQDGVQSWQNPNLSG